MTENKKHIFTVAELNRHAKDVLEDQFAEISVMGEISGIARPSSGHLYFTLKDDSASIRCAMFRQQNMRLNFNPENGNEIVVVGQISIYAARGDYQMIVKSMEPHGEGALMQQFEKLKNNLKEEGLFDTEYKKIIPKYPKHIGIITSESTAALQDVISAFERRAPNAQLTTIPAIVQGDLAPKSLINAIKNAERFNFKNSHNQIDLLIICRGGGSIEDLWCFNNEDLARKIYELKIPIISGVGHEIDFTIVDFVSDIRAPTPTAAAEMASESYFKINNLLEENLRSIKLQLSKFIQNYSSYIANLSKRIVSPKTIIRDRKQSLDNIEIRISSLISKQLMQENNRLDLVINNLKRSSVQSKLLKTKSELSSISQDIARLITDKIKNNNLHLNSLRQALNIVSPYSILERGYAIVSNKKNEIVKNANSVRESDVLSVKLSKGEIEVIVKNE